MDPNQTAQPNSFAPANPQDNQTQQTAAPYAFPTSGNKPGQMSGLDATPVENVTTIYQPENTIHKRFEATPPAPETFKPVEIPAQQETPSQAQPAELPQQAQVPSQATPIKPNIVDQTKTTTKLHHLENVTDTLTSLADKEEEEFIQQVETAHGTK